MIKNLEDSCKEIKQTMEELCKKATKETVEEHRLMMDKTETNITLFEQQLFTKKNSKLERISRRGAPATEHNNLDDQRGRGYDG